jgi:hypothetical protein
MWIQGMICSTRANASVSEGTVRKALMALFGHSGATVRAGDFGITEWYNHPLESDGAGLLNWDVCCYRVITLCRGRTAECNQPYEYEGKRTPKAASLNDRQVSAFGGVDKSDVRSRKKKKKSYTLHINC